MASATADVAPQVLRIFTNDLNTREGLERLGWARHHLLLSEGEEIFAVQAECLGRYTLL